MVSWTLTGATTSTWGRVAEDVGDLDGGGRAGHADEVGAAPGWTIMSMPMPLVRVRWPLSMPSMMAAMERIMMTSMATAKALMSERRGRWTRLPTTSLFMLLPVYGRALWRGARQRLLARRRELP